MNIQRLRNLTTGRLHTSMGDIYEDMETLTGIKRWMTRQLPNVAHAMKPWLREKVTEPRFWDDAYDTAHTGEFELAPMTADERAAFGERYRNLPNPLLSIGSGL